jgi:NAD(P)-dependent dehydrogenase (short-subunit alcohol dehydrogenase family)
MPSETPAPTYFLPDRLRDKAIVITGAASGIGAEITRGALRKARWNYTVRLYRPRAQILNGTWKFPDAKAVN